MVKTESSLLLPAVIEAAECRDGFLDHLRDCGFLGDIGLDGDGLAGGGLDYRDRGVDFRLGAGADTYTGTGLSVTDGDAATDAAAGAGDDGHFIGESSRHLIGHRDQAAGGAGERIALNGDAEDIDPGSDGAALAVASVPCERLVAGDGCGVADQGDLAAA